MKRRTVLATAVAAAVTGCSAGPSVEPTTTTRRRPTPTGRGQATGAATRGRAASAMATPRRRHLEGGSVTAVTVDPAPSGVPFRHELAFSGQPTADSPGRLELAVRNADDQPHTLRSPNRQLPVPDLASQSPDGGSLVLLGSVDDAERRDHCWVGRARRRPMFAERTLAPGKSVRGTYALVTAERVDGCYPAGTHEFEHAFTVDPDGENREYRWRFAVRVA